MLPVARGRDADRVPLYVGGVTVPAIEAAAVETDALSVPV
jgi:hypothetical protein